MEIQTTRTFKRFFQYRTLNADKKKSYYQLYDVKSLRAFHKQAMMKQQIYENMLARRSGVDYSPGIQCQPSLMNMEEAKELTMINQPEKKQLKRCRCGFIKQLRVFSKDCPVGLAIRKAEHWLGDRSISIRSKEVSRRCNSRGREQISGGRGRWGG